MAINRLAISNPTANFNTLLHSSERNAVVSIVATNKSGTTDASVRIWVQPNGSTGPSDYAYIAYDVNIPAVNSLETFKFAINHLDTIYVRSSTASVSFILNGIYESNGTSNITAGTTYPTNPQIGDVFVNTVANNVLYWTGSTWYSGTANTSTYPFPVYQSASPTNPIVGQLWIDSDSSSFEITEDRLVPISAGSNNGMHLVSDGTYGKWQSIPTEIPSYTSASGQVLTNNGSSLFWTNSYAPLASPNFIGVITASSPLTNDSSTKVATTQWVVEKNYLTSSAALAFAAPKYDPIIYNTLTLNDIKGGYLYSAAGSGSVSAIIPTITVGTSTIAAGSASTSLTGLVSTTFTDIVTTTGKQILYTGYFNGIESNTYYWRSPSTFRWYVNATPDTGTSDRMELTATGLTVNGVVDTGQAVQLSSTTTVNANNTATSVAQVASATYRSMEVILSMTQGTNYTATKVLALHDGTDVTFTEYGAISDGTPVNYTLSGNVSGGNMIIYVSSTNAATTNVAVKAHITAMKV